MRFKLLCVLFLVFIGFSQVTAAQECSAVAATLESLEGVGRVSPEGGDEWQPVRLGHHFCYGDTFKVEELRAVLRLENDTLVKLNQGSVLKFVAPKGSFWVEVVDGIAHFISRTPKRFTVKAPYLNAGVEGTEFIVSHDADRDTVSVIEGVVVAENTLGKTRLQAMQQSFATQNSAPSHALVISLPDVADWSLYYPPAFIPTGVSSPAEKAYLRGDFSASYQLALIENNADITAALALFYGQVTVFDEAILSARPLVSQVLLVFQSLAKGNSSVALSDSAALVATHPKEPSALLALSYVQQAAGELLEALATVQQAKLLSGSAIVELRLAELALINGKQSLAKQSLKSLKQANFYSNYADSLRALIALQNNRNRKAFKILKASVNQNPNIPLSQFALGLTHIRLGKLEAGRQKLELAVALDPSNSLYRSYLGKAYAEENRAGKAQDQLDLAKILDPNDPTPWFYQGLNQQANGEYAGAIDSYEKSLELNDSRYTYRSSNVLQNDAAIKSANIGTAYSQRGLKKKAESLGSEIISEDPNSYAGHRLLVEAYSDDSQREALLASSRLKATISQPLGAKALPIGLLEPGLRTAIGASPTDIGISEYTQLFIEDGVGGHATLLGGSEGLRAYDVLVQGKGEQVSINLGQYRYETDGYRANNDVSYLLSNALVHWMPTSDLSLQFEFSRFEYEQGDLNNSLDADDFLPGVRDVGESNTHRLSLNYLISEQQGIFVNYFGRRRSSNYNNTISYVVDDVEEFYDSTIDDLSNVEQYDIRYNYRAGKLGFIVGLNYLKSNFFMKETYFGYPFEEEEHVGMKSIYFDFTTRFNSGVFLDYGFEASYLEQFMGEGISALSREFSDGFLPYIGGRWDFFSGMSLRAAYSESYSFDSKTYVNLKKTNISGFSRILDFSSGTKVDLIGVGFDWSLGKKYKLYFESKDYSLLSSVYAATIDGSRYNDLPVGLSSNTAWIEYTSSVNSAITFKLEEQKYSKEVGEKNINHIPAYLDSNYVDVEFKIVPVIGVDISFLGRYLKQELKFSGGGSSLHEEVTTLGFYCSYYMFGRRGVVKVGVNNLTDKKYLVAEQALFSDRSGKTDYAHGRSYLGSVTYNF